MNKRNTRDNKYNRVEDIHTLENVHFDLKLMDILELFVNYKDNFKEESIEIFSEIEKYIAFRVLHS